MARNPENMSRAVGQPPIDAPLGGRPMPELKPARRNHTGRNLAIAGTLAAAVGAAAFGVSQLGKNEGTNPEFTPPAGGIVEPSNSPIPTPFSTESPTITLPPSPEVTPTLEPTPTRPPIIKAVEAIIEVPVEKTSIKAIKLGTENLYKENPKAGALYPQSAANFNLSYCENGAPDAAGNASKIQSTRMTYCRFLVVNNYRVYQITGDLAALKLAREAYWYGVSQYKDDFKNFADPAIKIINN